MDNLNDKLSNEAQIQPSCLGAVISSIELLKTDMERWKEALEENAKDNEKYSAGLLKGYNAAIGQFQNRLGKYCI
jgi:tRNA A-37 threonylcarbamoyl transferase component Bud32